MQQVAPSTSLRIVYLIQDHTDSNTYYVRSVVRDSVSGAILATINLADTGNRRFFGTYQTPAAEDKYIDITTTVYSDSGYTTKAQDKYEDIDQYLVKTQWGLQFGGQGGGDTIVKGAEVDYKRIRKIIKEEVAKLDKETKEYDDAILNSKLDAVYKCVEDIKRITSEEDEPEDIDFSPLMAAIKELPSKLNFDPIIKIVSETQGPKEVNFAPILNAIQEVKDKLNEEDEVEVEEVKEEKPKLRTFGGLYTPGNPVDKRVKNLI